jgi:hypothetical protein
MLAGLRSRTLILVLLGSLFPGSGLSQGAQASFSADAVKAAFLMRFGDYVSWPTQPVSRSNFVIAVIGAPSVAAQLRRMPMDRLIDGRTPEIREVSSANALAEEDILFIGAEASPSVTRIAVTSRNPCLIVTEQSGALEEGSMINFVLIDQRVRFEVSLPAAEARGLKLSSRLLGVAERVIRPHEGAVPADDAVGFGRNAQQLPASDDPH